MVAAQQAPSSPAATSADAAAAAEAAADAQAAEQDEGAESGESEEIVVTGSRKLPGAVVGDIPPDQTLGQAEIRSYGVSTVSDLLNELSPQTTSGRGSGGAGQSSRSSGPRDSRI
jgi:iron complex outermembrane receptor protein